MQPQNANIIVSKAQCLKELRRNEDAIASYKLALNIDPKNVAAKAQLFDLLNLKLPLTILFSLPQEHLQYQYFGDLFPVLNVTSFSFSKSLYNTVHSLNCIPVKSVLLSITLSPHYR